MKIVIMNLLAGLYPVQLNEGAQIWNEHLHSYGSNKALGSDYFWSSFASHRTNGPYIFL